MNMLRACKPGVSQGAVGVVVEGVPYKGVNTRGCYGMPLIRGC